MYSLHELFLALSKIDLIIHTQSSLACSLSLLSNIQGDVVKLICFSVEGCSQIFAIMAEPAVDICEILCEYILSFLGR